MTQEKKDWKERTEMLIGKEGLERLANARIAVIGVGGVGGYAAEMLVRAGIGHLVILDSDEVSLSNRNRQLIALESTLGQSKCKVLKSRLLDINPELDIECIEEFIVSDGATSDPKTDGPSGTASELLDRYTLDFLVDAIDTLSPKLSLIKYCLDRKIPLVSSMGAGAKFDATRIHITDISKSFQCPLAHMVRKRLGKMGIRKGFKVVFSDERPDRESVSLEASRNKKSQVGTISYMPAVFGCVCAQAVITGLLESNAGNP